MSAFAKRSLLPVSLVWALLVIASLASAALAEGNTPPRLGATAAILIAAAKIDLIIGQYMELRWSHRPLRLLLACWLAVVTLILLAGIWLAHPFTLGANHV